MEMQIREYQKQDFQPLKEIIRSTWHYDEFSSPETASRLAEVFLRSCLTNYTFSQVAVLDGTAAGIILVKNNKDHRCAPLCQISANPVHCEAVCVQRGKGSLSNLPKRQ